MIKPWDTKAGEGFKDFLIVRGMDAVVGYSQTFDTVDVKVNNSNGLLWMQKTVALSHVQNSPACLDPVFAEIALKYLKHELEENCEFLRGFILSGRTIPSWSHFHQTMNERGNHVTLTDGENPGFVDLEIRTYGTKGTIGRTWFEAFRLNDKNGVKDFLASLLSLLKQYDPAIPEILTGRPSDPDLKWSELINPKASISAIPPTQPWDLSTIAGNMNHQMVREMTQMVMAKLKQENAFQPGVQVNLTYDMDPENGTPNVRISILKPVEKSSEEWTQDPEFENKVILDPDGWDRRNFDASWGEPITRDEFRRRLQFSTVSDKIPTPPQNIL